MGGLLGICAPRAIWFQYGSVISAIVAGHSILGLSWGTAKVHVNQVGMGGIEALL